MDNKEKLRVVFLKIMNVNALRLFGCLLRKFDIEMINPDLSRFDTTQQKEITNGLTAFVSINKDIIYMGIFEDFVSKHTIPELIYVVAHEILHVLGGDGYRCGARHRDIWNLSCDHVINQMLDISISKNEITATSPESRFIIKELINQDQTKEEVYEWLMKKIDTCQSIGQITIPGTGYSLDVKEVDLKNGQKIIVTEEILSDSGSDSKDESITNAIKAEAKAIMDSIEDKLNQGSGSSYLKDFIKGLIEVSIPWTDLILRSISSKMVPSTDNHSWRNINKRMKAIGYMMPGMDMDIRPHQLIIGEDTSGSIGKTDLQKFGSVIKQSAGYFDEIRIIKHDMQIAFDETCNSSEFNEAEFTLFHPGRGGTSHKFIFDAIEKSYDDGEDISLIILLTDFESDIEQIWKNYTFHKYVPIQIILNYKNPVPKHIDKSPILITS